LTDKTESSESFFIHSCSVLLVAFIDRVLIPNISMTELNISFDNDVR